jgi:hypothetical protein
MKYRIFYMRDKVKRPFGCVAIALDEKSKRVAYQLTTINPADTYKDGSFDRKVARLMTMGRLVESPIELVIPKHFSAHDITAAVMSDICSTKNAPSRSKKAAKRWLKDNYKQSIEVVTQVTTKKPRVKPSRVKSAPSNVTKLFP